MAKSKRFDMWFFVKIGLALLFFLILIYPMFGILRQSVLSPSQKGLTLEHFRKFFDGNYYISTLANSFKVTVAVTLLSMLFALPLSYF